MEIANEHGNPGLPPNIPVGSMTPHETTDGGLYYTFPALDALPHIRHAFSTRLGGVSEGIFESMNLSFTRGDDEACVHENFRRFCAAVGTTPDRTVLSAQTHTANILCVAAADGGRGVTRERGYTDIDGLLTEEDGVALCTQYADCVPLFFADPVRHVIGTAHAGWKGTAAGIGAAMVERMQRDYGCRPEDIVAAIGPSIGFCCFEVDAPVYEVFAALPLTDEHCFTVDGGGKYHVDLWEINRRWLRSAGLSDAQITVGGLCTRCRPDVFWSHRATGGERGSLAAIIVQSKA